MIQASRVYRPRQIHDLTGLPLVAVYEALSRGDLAGVRRGRGWIVSGAAVIEFVESLGR